MRFYQLLFTLLLLGALLPARGQELLVNFSVDDNRIQGDKQIFQDMQQTISRYLNGTRFTTDQFDSKERIRVNFRILVNSRPSADYFECEAFIQVFRPVYNTTYETMVLNHNDKSFSFSYVPFQQMAYVENTFTDNLTSLLNFYAFIILGMDYDSFAPGAGAPWFAAAQDILNLASTSASESGWRSNQDQRNRYWLLENLTNNSYRAFHQIVYKYHRTGLDQMESRPDVARKAILESLKELQALNRVNPLLVVNKTFLDAKDAELVKVFKQAFPADKQEFIAIMQEVDPSNMARYQSVME
jgi:hypothetical protein